jgi:hypothetical protein
VPPEANSLAAFPSFPGREFVVRRLCALVFILFGVAIAVPAHAASQPETPQQADCGKTAAEALIAARAALASSDTSKDRAALVCLIAAVTALDARERSFEEGKQQSGILLVPTGSYANQRGP